MLRSDLLRQRGDGGLVPSLTLGTSMVTVMDVLRMSSVGLGDRMVETERDKFYRSLESEVHSQGDKDCREQKLTFWLFKLRKGKFGEILSSSDNIVSYWNFFNTPVKITSETKEGSDVIYVTLVSEDNGLLTVIRKEMEQLDGK